MTEKYDLIFSIGRRCYATGLIRKYGLQIESYPLDWVYDATFDERIKVLDNKFKDFLRIEDMVYIEDYNETFATYKNTKTGFAFNHFFLAHKPLEESFYNVKALFQKRIDRLFNRIEKANDILMIFITTDRVYGERENQISDEKLIEVVAMMKRNYPNKNIKLLYIEDTKDSRPDKLTKIQLNEYITKYLLANSDELEDEKTTSDFKEIFVNYELRKTFLNKLNENYKAFLYRIAKNLPTKQLRTWAKDKLTR